LKPGDNVSVETRLWSDAWARKVHGDQWKSGRTYGKVLHGKDDEWVCDFAEKDGQHAAWARSVLRIEESECGPAATATSPTACIGIAQVAARAPMEEVALTEHRPKRKQQDLEGMALVRQALEALRLGEYADAFEEMGYDDLEFIQSMNGEQLQTLATNVRMKPGHFHKLQDWLPNVERRIASHARPREALTITDARQSAQQSAQPEHAAADGVALRTSSRSNSGEDLIRTVT
jgi:hypothetical protein